MQLTSNAFEFAKLILKHNPKEKKKHHHSHGCGPKEEKEDPLANVPIKIEKNPQNHSKSDNYSINYEEKW
jgi:hypothetical protein